MLATARPARQTRAQDIDHRCQLWEQAGPLERPCVHPIRIEVLNDRPVPVGMVEGTTHEACLQHAHRRLGALIFGSPRKPGGGWRSGAKAQEEDVSLASTWGYQAERAPPGFYGPSEGMGPDAALVAKGWWLLDVNGHELQVPVECVFASVAAPNRSVEAVASCDPYTLEDCLARRLVAAFDAWQDAKVDCGVVGAIGCGVFKWDGTYSARALRKALASSRFTGDVVLGMTDTALAQVFGKILAAPTLPRTVF